MFVAAAKSDLLDLLLNVRNLLLLLNLSLDLLLNVQNLLLLLNATENV
jgi:hypothetical protein